jgi:ATP-dependent helicase/nuclease subunit A
VVCVTVGGRKRDRNTLNPLSPTPQQQRAIAARGNVLVVAGAGAGKTQTVVDRCLAWLLDPKNAASIDQILMVTFTQAAAAEMRQRLRANLEAALSAAEKTGRPPLPLAEQLALLDTAHIGTLHSFCFHLVSRHSTIWASTRKPAFCPRNGPACSSAKAWT